MKRFSRFSDFGTSVITVRTKGKIKNTNLVFDRESRVSGIDVQKIRKSHIAVIGAGGLGGLISLGLVRKGVGCLSIYDGDIVEASNLNRQRFFSKDIDQPKSFALAKNLVAETVCKTTLRAVDLYFEEAVQEGLVSKPSLAICAPDDDKVRAFAAKYWFEQGVPLITTGLSEDADYGYIHVEDGSSARGCWLCLRKGKKGKKKCGVAASINLPMVVSGFILTASDAILSGYQLPWNYRQVSLVGQIPDMHTVVPVWPKCPVCAKSG